ncbi:MAG: DUF1684 domain-containing protein [Nitrososphaerales archaeon]|jgi:uncharacterized protein (DUF1684 family)
MKPEDVETWRRALMRARERKDLLFRSDSDSPIGPGEFTGLKYFEPDPEFRFETELHRIPVPGSVIMTTSKGTRQLFNSIGYFELSIGGKTVRLSAYQSAEREDPSIFVPFRDSTSGGESYGAARYLDLEVEHDDRYAVDFNFAYNPYCAYSDAYVCPLPPRENWLVVAIRAGEKKYHD